MRPKIRFPLSPRLVLRKQQGKEKSAKEVEDALEEAGLVADGTDKQVNTADVLKVKHSVRAPEDVGRLFRLVRCEQ